MKKKKLIIYVLLIVTFFGVSIVSSGEVRKKGFSISVPDGWVEIPRDIIDAQEKEMARLAPNAEMQHYDYGFQLGSSKKWFEYPYILVQVKNTGRVPESQLEKLEGYSFKNSLDKQKKAFGSMLTDIQIGKMVYDKQNKMIWLRVESNAANIGPISVISGMVPTEKGFIIVMGGSLREYYPTYEYIFRKVAISVSPEPGLVYKQKWSDSLPSAVAGIDWGKAMGKAIAGTIVAGIIGVIIALIDALRKKKNHIETNKDVSAGMSPDSAAKAAKEKQPPSIQSNESALKKCPYCAETIKAEAIKCRFCGERLDRKEFDIKTVQPESSHQLKNTDSIEVENNPEPTLSQRQFTEDLKRIERKTLARINQIYGNKEK